MTATRLHRYPSPSGGFALGKMGVGATMLKQGNFWIWPTSMRYVSVAPTTVWMPQTGVWYGGIADNGYGTETQRTERTFNEYSYHNWNQGGYSMVQFFELPSGTYKLTFDFICQLFADTADLYLMPYVASGAGYVKATNLSRQYSVVDHGNYKTATVVFTVPATARYVGIYISGKNANNRRGCTIQNVCITSAI